MHGRQLRIAAAFIIGVTLSSGVAAAQLRVPVPSGHTVLNPKVLLPKGYLFKLSCMSSPNGNTAIGIEFSNVGTTTIPKGYKVHWKFFAPVEEGDYTFPWAVPPGSGIRFGGLTSQTAGKGCDVTAVQ